MMAEVQSEYASVTKNDDKGILNSSQSTYEMPAVFDDNSEDTPPNVDSEDDAPKKFTKKRVHQFSDSDSANEEMPEETTKIGSKPRVQSSDSDSDVPIFKSVPQKSRIQRQGSESDSESDLDKKKHSGSDQPVKNKEQQSRMKNKRSKLQDKFQNLKTSRGKGVGGVESDLNNSNSSEDSNDESSSMEKIKQKIKERMSFKPSICDPDTSDEERTHQKHLPNQKKRRSTKLTSPKPQRMSAKQAMENMQKIKSESNRMLREKEVSLPYHRPKALTLKDIMNRRKPALSADGKTLPIKMNGEQLKQYAQQLEERQKQMMELWQSDSEEDENANKSDDEKDPTENRMDGESKNDEDATNEDKNEAGLQENDKDADKTAKDNDKLFDDWSQSILDESKTNESFNDNISTDTKTSNEDKIEVNEANSKSRHSLEELDSETSMKLVFNESENSIIEENKTDAVAEAASSTPKDSELKDQLCCAKRNTEESQLISLHYDTEKPDSIDTELQADVAKEAESETNNKCSAEDKEAMDVNDFSDEEIMNIEDIDKIIENADIIRDIEDRLNSQVLVRDITINPKLTGAPGMVIDLDDMNTAPKKSGVELLKERFTYFAKLKSSEELEREREKRVKPGTQHSKLKQVLEEQMAEQRSLEWAKRLDDEKQHQKELNELRGEGSDDDNEIDKLEAKLEGDEVNNKSDSESEDELEVNDIEMNDKPRVHNPMLENEAAESDCDEPERDDKNIDDEENDDDVDDESSDDSDSSQSEEDETIMKKGRILKAFEDSDDEDIKTEQNTKDVEAKPIGSVSQHISQDEVITLAQRHKSVSEDLFPSQGSSVLPSQNTIAPEKSVENDVDLGTQTFSILESSKNITTEEESHIINNMSVICETQPFDGNLDAVAAMCSGSFSQSLPLLPIPTQISQSLPLGDDVLALCTGKFYNNEFISQVADNEQLPLGASQAFDSLEEESQTDKNNDITSNDANEMGPTQVTLNHVNIHNLDNDNTDIELNKVVQKTVDDNLKSILDELDDPEFDTPRPNKFFCGDKTNKNKQKEKEVEIQTKKRLIIDSDDETSGNETTKRKKLKKKKAEKRALQISDDEESENEEIEEYESEIEEETTERLVEYDSEENEIEIKPKNASKKKRKGNEFFEQEAELTSEDEWVGSGDEDEAGLDRMEREEGDDETFHQGQLQKELGQIHMRDVLDQDKREVRIIQELLFEDGDLGAGGRQRKFKWKNLDGEEETGAAVDEFGNTQEQEFESEEQWRKQRHERETYLRQMQNNGDLDDSLNVTINRTAIIKANLSSKSVSMLLEESAAVEKTDPVVVEKNTTSPKKPFSLLQQNYQGSILNRGRGALARLAALATPLAVDDDTPKVGSLAPSSKRNFVFSALTPEAPKVTKRKADSNPSTPKLVKKMRTEEKQNFSKSSLIDHMKL